MIKDLQQDQAKRFSADSSVNDDDDDDNEVRDFVDNNDGFYVKMYEMAGKFAATRIGQFVIDRGDRVLRSIEETAKWSLPKDSLRVKLVRPYSWGIFITLIVMLRIIRIALSFGAFLIGNRPVTAYDMVYFLQTRRRKLRAIRFDGLKNIQRYEDQANVFRFNGTGCFTSRISALLSIAICQPGKHCLPGGHDFTEHEYIQNERGEKDENTDNNKSNRQPVLELCDDPSDQGLTFDQMLTKYADADSEDDPDFVPQPDEEESSDEPSISSDSSTNKNSAEEKEDDVEDFNHIATQTVLQPENENEGNILNGLSNSPEKTNANKSLLDQSVEIKKSDNHKHLLMPKPITEIKTEPLSDIDSGSEQSVEAPRILENENATSRGSEQEEKEREAHQSDKAKPMEMITYNDLPSQSEEREELVKTRPHLPTLGPTAVAALSNDDSPNGLPTFSSFSPSILLSSSSIKLSENSFRGTRKSKGSLAMSSTSAAHDDQQPTPSPPSISPSPTTPPTPPSTPPPTPISLISTSSANSIFASAQSSPSKSPSPLPDHDTASAMPPVVEMGENSAMTSASSSEDTFYSPIGSPPNFGTSVPTEGVLKSSSDVTTIQELAELNLAHSSPQFKENDGTSVVDSTPSSSSPSPAPLPPPPPEKKYVPQQSFKNRFRGRNRR